MADDVLPPGVQGISDLITVPGLINLDFADVRTHHAGWRRGADGHRPRPRRERAVEAARQAISSPLLEDISIDGATGVLFNITGGADLTLLRGQRGRARHRRRRPTRTPTSSSAR